MKYKLATAVLAVTAMVVATLTATTVTTTHPAHAATASPVQWPIDTWGTPQPTDDAVLKWDEQLLSAAEAYPKATGPTSVQAIAAGRAGGFCRSCSAICFIIACHCSFTGPFIFEPTSLEREYTCFSTIAPI